MIKGPISVLRKRALVCLLLVSSAAPLFANEEIDLGAQQILLSEMLEEAIDDYNALVERITNEKRKLISPVNEKRLQVNELRNESDGLLLNRSERISELKRIEDSNTTLTKQIDFVEALIVDHLSNFDALINPAEDQLYRPSFTEIRIGEGLERSREEQILARLEVVDLSLERIERAIGGYGFEGKAVNQAGDILEGRISLAGPNAYFFAKNGKTGGQLQLETNSLLPSISEYPEIALEEIEDLSKGEQAAIPVDVTLGSADEFQRTKWTFSDHVRKGGIVGYAILGFAGIALLIVLTKIFDLSRIKGLNTVSIHDLIDRNPSEALEIAEKKQYPANRVLATALKYAKHETIVIEEAIVGEIQTVKNNLERLLPFLAIIAATTPLMGLLGTVVGMIKTFSLITIFGSGNAQDFSSGISEALVTTEFGLIVAIPTLIVHGVLLRAARERIGTLEDLASEFVISLQESKIED